MIFVLIIKKLITMLKVELVEVFQLCVRLLDEYHRKESEKRNEEIAELTSQLTVKRYF